MTNHRLKSYFYLFIVAVIWGVAGPIIKYTLGGISTIPFLVYRFGISSLLSIFLLIPTYKSIIKNNILVESIIFGFLTSTVALGLLFLGMEKTTVLDMSFITLTAPLMIAIGGALFLKDRITKREKLGITIAFFGSLITIIQPIFENGININQITGNLLIFAYLLVNTVSVIMAKRLVRKGASPIALTSLSFIIGFISFAPLILFSDSFSLSTLTSLPFPYHLGVLFMAIMSGNIAYTLWVKGQKTIEVSEAALFNYLYPVFSAPLAVYWLGEKVTLAFLLGALIIIIGVIIAEYKKGRRSKTL